MHAICLKRVCRGVLEPSCVPSSGAGVVSAQQITSTRPASKVGPQPERLSIGHERTHSRIAHSPSCSSQEGKQEGEGEVEGEGGVGSGESGSADRERGAGSVHASFPTQKKRMLTAVGVVACLACGGHVALAVVRRFARVCDKEGHGQNRGRLKTAGRDKVDCVQRGSACMAVIA